MGMLKWAVDYNSRDNAPKTVVLQKGKNGFGFVLRGAKGKTFLHVKKCGD